MGPRRLQRQLPSTAHSQVQAHFLRDCGLQKLHTGPTYRHPVHGNSTLDHIYTNSLHINSHGLLDDSISDHLPIYAIKKQEKAKIEVKKVTGRSYRNYSTEGLVAHLRETGLEEAVSHMNDPTEVYNRVVQDLTSYLDNTCPVKDMRIKNPDKPEFTPEVYNLVRRRKKCLRRSKNIGRGVYNIHLAQANRLNKLINTKLADNQRKSVVDNLRSSTTQSASGLSSAGCEKELIPNYLYD